MGTPLRFLGYWSLVTALAGCADADLPPASELVQVAAIQGDAALCASFTAGLSRVGLTAQPSVCYRESAAIPGGCATCLVGLPVQDDATLPKMQELCATLPCHAEMVRSPLRSDPADVRRPAAVFDTSFSVEAARYSECWYYCTNTVCTCWPQ